MHRLLVVGLALFAASSAHARNGGLYFELAPSWGFYFTEEVIIEDGDDDNGDFPEAGFVPQLKLGVNLFGFGGFEADMAGFFWDPGIVERGGGAFAGGAIRITPLEFLQFALPPDQFQLPRMAAMPPGPTSWRDRPFDLGFYMGGGYTIVGEDYAYQGAYFKWGFDLKYFVTPQFAIGIDLPFRHTFYQPFRYTNFNDATGLCTDGAQGYGFIGDTRIDVDPTPNENAYDPIAVSAEDVDERCLEDAPSAVFFAPALTITGVFDFGI